MPGFVKAIAIRQFGKAAQYCWSLGASQSSSIAPRDDICNSAIAQLKSGMVPFLRSHPIPVLDVMKPFTAVVNVTPLPVA